MHSEVPRLIDRSGGTSIVYKNRDLYGTGDPQETAGRRARSFQLRSDTLYLLASPLLWYGTVEILERLPEGSFLLAVEHDPALASISSEHVPEAVSCHVSFTFIQSSVPEVIYKTIEEIGIESFRRVQLISLNAGYRLFNSSYSRLHQLLQEEIQQFWLNKYTLMHMLPLWIKNIFRNIGSIPSLSTEVSLATVRPETSLPVLVVGAGPSLEENLPFLITRRKEFFLLAVDTAFAPLKQAGIKPDAVVVQEAQFFNLYDFIPFPHLDTLLIADISSYAGVLQLARNGIHFVSARFADIALFRRLEKHGLLPSELVPMGSVGSTAVDIALRLTRGPVICTGIDYAFLPGKTHTNNSPQHLRMLTETYRLQPLIDLSAYSVNGVRFASGTADRLLTTATLERYASNFNRVFKEKKRLFRLHPAGLPLEIPTLELCAAEDIISQWKENRGSAGEDRETAAAAPRLSGVDAGRIAAFFSAELDLLQSVYALGWTFLHGASDTATETDLLAAINQCEYLFLSFPETGLRLRFLDPTMVKRILVSAGHYIRLIKNAHPRS